MSNKITNNSTPDLEVKHKLRSKELFFYGFLVVYIIILIYLCGKVSFWEDEFYTINTTSHNLSGVISQSYNFEGQPPVYFILLKIWRVFNDGFFFARLFSIVCILLAAVFFIKLLRLVSDTVEVRWLLIIALLNPFTVWAALEMRTYALLIVLSTVTIYYFLNWTIRNKTKHLLIFLIISTIGLYTQYLFVILIISLSFSFLVFRGWKAFFKLCICLIPVVLIFLPNLIFLESDINIANHETRNNTVMPIISKIFQTPPKLILGVNRLPAGDYTKLFIIVVAFLFYIYSYYILYRKHLVSKDPLFQNINFIFVTVLVFIGLFCFAFTITRISYAHQYMAIAFPLFISIFAILKVHASFLRKLLYALLSVYYILLLLITYRNPIKFYDFKSIAKYVNKIEHTGEPIFFYRNQLSLPFCYYYTGNNLIYPLPHAVTYDKEYLTNIKDTIVLKQIIGSIDRNSDTFFLISDENFNSFNFLDMNRGLINTYLNNNYKTTLDTVYFGENKDYLIRIRRLVIKH